MRGNDFSPRQARLGLEGVDVLRPAAFEAGFLVQQGDEVVDEGGFDFAGPQVLCKGVERLWLLVEIIDVEYSLRAGKVEALQVVV